MKRESFVFHLAVLLTILARVMTQTYINSLPNSPSTFTKALSPYIVTQDVSTSSTLTVEAGVTVMFQRGAGLRPAQLIAEGTVSDRILFTAATNQVDDEWAGIRALSMPSVLKFVTIEYSGYDGPNNCAVVYYGTLTFEDSVIQHTSGSGLCTGYGNTGIAINYASMAQMSISVTDSTLIAGTIGVSVNAPGSDFSTHTITNNTVTAGTTGVTLYVAGRIMVHDNTISATGIAVSAGFNCPSYAGTTTILRNTITGGSISFTKTGYNGLCTGNQIMHNTISNVYNDAPIIFFDSNLSDVVVSQNNILDSILVSSPAIDAKSYAGISPVFQFNTITNVTTGGSYLIKLVGPETYIIDGVQKMFETNTFSYVSASTLLKIVGYEWNIQYNVFQFSDYLFLVASDTQADELSMGYNYWGTDNGTLIREGMFDALVHSAFALILFSPFYWDNSRTYVSTEVSEQIINANTAWSTARELQKSVYVRSGNSLTITADIRLHRAVSIIVDGTLIVDGAVLDSYGTDQWGSIVFRKYAQMAVTTLEGEYLSGSVLTNATLLNSGDAASSSAIVHTAGNLYIKNCVIEVDGDAIYTEDNGLPRNVHVIDSTITLLSDSTGITTYGGGVTITDCEFSGTNIACAISDPTALELKSNTFTGCGVVVENPVPASSYIGGNTFTLAVTQSALVLEMQTVVGQGTFDIKENTFSQNVNPVRIVMNLTACDTNAFNVHVIHNDFLDNSGQSLIDYSSTGQGSRLPACNFVFTSNDFIINNNVDEAMLVISGLASIVNLNDFDYSQGGAFVKYSLSDIRLNFKRNNFKTVNPSIINSKIIVGNGNDPFEYVNYSPAYDDDNGSFFDFDQMCFVEGANCTWLPSCFDFSADDEDVCSGRGVCAAPEYCRCESGFFGDRCEQFACFGINPSNSSVCSAHGSCLNPNTCLCDTDFVGLECEVPVCFGILGNDSTVCSENGLCTSNNTCECYPGRTGQECETNICYGVIETNSSVCSQHGTCIAPNSCQCNPDYVGQECEVPVCFGIIGNSSLSCNGHGTCMSNNTCNCFPQYLQDDCSEPVCFGIPGFDPSSCSYHGTCLQPDFCSCSTGYAGSNCSEPICFGINATEISACSGQGVCIQPDTCQCGMDYTGILCDIPLCFGYNATDPMSCGFGDCIAPDTCDCLSLGAGVNCSTPICYGYNASDPLVCNGHGVCDAPGSCDCQTYYSGANCSAHSAYRLIALYKTSISVCENATIQVQLIDEDYGVQSTIPPLVWELLSPSPNSQLSDYLAGKQDANIVIPRNYFVIGQTYSISINVSYQDQNLTTTISFTVDNLNVTLAVPSVLRRNSEYIFSATVHSCLSGINYGWTVFLADNIVANVASNSAKLTIPKYTLIYGNYMVQLITTAQGVTQAHSTTFQMIAQSPSVTIKNGNTLITTGTNYTLQTSTSDPDNLVLNGMFRWDCVMNGTVCNISGSTTSKLAFKPTIPGEYYFSVTYQTQDLRNSTDSVIVTVLPATVLIPRVSIITDVPRRVRKQQKLSVETRLEPSSDIASMNLKWTLTASNSSVDILRNNTLLSSTTARALVFIPSGLASGITYTLQIAANYIGQAEKTYSQVSFSLLSPLTIGSLVIEPETGHQLDTLFRFTASGWMTDTDAYPLRYAFEYLDSNNNYIPIRSLDVASTFSKQILAGRTNTTQIRCKVQNTYGVEAFVTKNITVLPTAVENALALVNNIRAGLGDQSSLESSYQLIIAATLAVEQLKDPSLMSYILEDLQALNDTTSSDLKTQKVEILQIITSDKTLLDTDIQLHTLDLVSGIFSSDTESSSTIYSTAGNVISNVISSSSASQNQEVAEKSGNAVRGLSKYVLNSITPGEAPTTISTDSFTMSVMKNYGSDLQNQSVSDGDNSVFIPVTTTLTNDVDDVLSAEYINFVDTGSLLWENKTTNISSAIVSFRLLDQDGNKVYFEASRDNPLVLTLSRSSSIVENSNETEIVCKYLNDINSGDDWKTDGCWLESASETQIVCHCNHTTSFAAFIQFTKGDISSPTTAQKAVYYVSVIVYSLFFIISLVLFVFLVVARNTQPVKSRLFAPYICLFAIMVESVLLVIRNGLLLASKPNLDAIDVLGYVIQFVANPLAIVSLFIFLWQMMRYMVLKHLYHIMSLDAGKLVEANKLRFVKIFTSGRIFKIASGIVYAISLAYFLAYTIAQWSLKSKLTEKAIDANSVALAVSFSGIILVLGFAIVALFLWDLVVVPIYSKRAQKQRQEREEGLLEFHQKQLENDNAGKKQDFIKQLSEPLQYHFLKDDPLYFRMNAIFMLASVVAMFISYGIGIANQYLKLSDHSAIMIASLVFDLLYTALRIFAYGGFVAVLRIIFIARERGNIYAEYVSHHSSEEDVCESNVSSLMESVITNKVGYALLKDYCLTEFSVENLYIWNTLKAMSLDWIVSSGQQRTEMMESLVTKYIISNAPYEVNIPSPVKKAILSMQKSMNTMTVQIQLETLNKLTISVLTNLSDTFSRFSETPEYQQFLTYYSLHNILDNIMNSKTKTQISWFSYELQ